MCGDSRQSSCMERRFRAGEHLQHLIFLAVLSGVPNVAAGTPISTPTIKTRKALDLMVGGKNENLATRNQAMNVWKQGNPQSFTYSPRDLLVGLVIQYNNMDIRSDDREYIVAWESDGQDMTEVFRTQTTCPDVELTVPSRGPYVYETRLDRSANSLHPECSCVPRPGRPCPAGVRATNASGSSTNLTSPVLSHFVHVENEWREWLWDPVILGRLLNHVEAPVKVVTVPVVNVTQLTGTDPKQGCPGTHDDRLGNKQVTRKNITDFHKTLPPGHVAGGWCLVHRGGCSETAKVKVCESSGAVGTIIVDHGNFGGDQDIVIVYNRGAGEAASKPILFLSKAEGERLAAWAQSGSGVRVAVGPTVGGPPPPGYTQGSGIIVHEVNPLSTAKVSKKYPDVFATAGWIEVSSIRDLLFVCQTQQSAVFIFDVSDPLRSIPLVGKIPVPCSRAGWHDYRILDYKGSDGIHYTLLVDPFDTGNRLFYFNTQDPARPVLHKEIHAHWEAASDGLGQVRPGGPNGKYHLVTWHCANLYCGKNHGDSLYVMNTHNLSMPASRVPLPQMGKGGFARDIACGADALCMISLTWDGLVAVDTGVQDTVNPMSVVAANGRYFNNAYIPESIARLRMHSGAQKVYASTVHARSFYVEHADFSLRPLRIGDSIRALQLTEIWIAEVVNYTATHRLPSTVAVPHPPSNTSLGCTWQLAPSCVHAFEYKGKHHRGCLTLGDGKSGWCSHDAIFAGVWSYCVSSCVHDCSRSGEHLAGGPGASYIIVCPAACGNYLLWGTRLYSDDSSMCAAGIHAGVITRAGGPIKVTLYAGQESYPSSTANAVTSYAWGRWARSFMVTAPAGQAPPPPTTSRLDACRRCSWEPMTPCVGSFRYENVLYHGCTTASFGTRGWCSHDTVYRGRWSECTSTCGRTCGGNAVKLEGAPGSTHLYMCPGACGASTAWGVDVYSDDSSVCTAAIHAGATTRDGGCVVVTIAQGVGTYMGSVRNGIRTFGWRAWARSFTVRNATVDSRTNIISLGSGQPKDLKDDAHSVMVLIIALVIVSVIAIVVVCGMFWLWRAYKKSQNMVRRLQVAPAIAGTGNDVVVGNPVPPEQETETVNPPVGAPVFMPATVVSTGMWATKYTKKDWDYEITKQSSQNSLK